MLKIKKNTGRWLSFICVTFPPRAGKLWLKGNKNSGLGTYNKVKIKLNRKIIAPFSFECAVRVFRK